MTNEAVMTTEALSRSDNLDLLELLPPGAAVERVPELPAGELGEPVTMILVPNRGPSASGLLALTARTIALPS